MTPPARASAGRASADELSSLTTAGKIDYRLCRTSGTISAFDHDLLRAMFLLWKAQ